MLTKPWLMAVRRGWLSLLQPTIRSYDDVDLAIARLQSFAENLREQVLNVRQTSEKEAVDAALQKLIKEIKEARRTARHWREAYEGRGPVPSARDRAEGEYMLDLYTNNFQGAIERSKPQRGRGGLVRPAPMTEFLDDALKILYKDAAYLQKQKASHEAMGLTMAIADPVFREFDLYGMKVVVVDPKHHGARIRGYVEYIEKAYKDLTRKGFKCVWYGTLFLLSDDYEKFSKEEQLAYAEAGYRDMERRAGSYHSGADMVRISVPLSDEVVHVIAHEMGHRYWFKVMSPGQRARFESLIEGDWSMLHAILLNQDKLDAIDDATSSGEAREVRQASRLNFLEDLYARVETGHDLNVKEKDGCAPEADPAPNACELHQRSRPTRRASAVASRGRGPP